jgi:serine/threonine protein kinase
MNAEEQLHELLCRWEDAADAGQEIGVTELCQDRPELRAELERRLVAVRLLKALAEDVNGAAAQSHTLPGRDGRSPEPVVPGYEILGELGRGGMGVVYKARHLRLDRLVALKMMRAGELADPLDRARFFNEARAIASLPHPNIVQIHDIGEQDGRPYFAFEYVRGGSLEHYLQGRPRPGAEAAALVETLARALEVVHGHGLVHRDLKPANILLRRKVTGPTDLIAYSAAPATATTTQLTQDEQDTQPDAQAASAAEAALDADASLSAFEPKLTDFGLVKRLVETEPGLTPSLAVLGTPSYMAPEQARGEARTVGPAVDIHALGGILYVLLTGRPPYLGVTCLETVQQVLSQEPVPPRRLQPGVPRDLETICLKCLNKDPWRRYPSALALASDLARFRAGRPISARPVGRLERVGRWCRRNPLATVLTAGLVAVVMLGLAGILWQWRQAVLAREQYRTQRDEAQKERAKFAAINKYLIKGLLKGATPEEARGKAHEITLREVLDQVAQEIETDAALAEQPEVEAAVRMTLGEVYLRLGKPADSEPHFRRAVRLRLSVLGPESEETLDARNNLAMAIQDLGRHAEAETLFRDVLDVARRSRGPDDSLTQIILSNLGTLLQEQGKLEEAVPILREVLDVSRREHGDDHEDVVIAMHNLAFVLRVTGRTDEAAPLAQHVLKAWRKHPGNDHPNTIAAMGNVAVILHAQGRTLEAEALLREQLAGALKVLGADHPSTALSMRTLALNLRDQRQHTEAEQLLRQALDRQRKVLPAGHAEIGKTLAALGDVLLCEQQIQQAEPVLREALEIQRKAFPAGHSDSAAGLLGSCLTAQGRYAEAEPLVREGYDVLANATTRQPGQLRVAMQRAVTLYEAWNRPAEAAAWREKRPDRP